MIDVPSNTGTDHNAGEGGFEQPTRRRGGNPGLFPLLLEEIPLGPKRGDGLLGVADGHDAGSLGNQRLHDQSIEIGPKLDRCLGRERRSHPGRDRGAPRAFDVARPAECHRLPVVGHRASGSWRSSSSMRAPIRSKTTRRRSTGRDCASRSSAVAHQSSSIIRLRPRKNSPRFNAFSNRSAAAPKIPRDTAICPIPMVRSTWSRGISAEALIVPNASRAATRSFASAFWRYRSTIGAGDDQCCRIAPRRLSPGDGWRHRWTLVVPGVVERPGLRQRRRLAAHADGASARAGTASRRSSSAHG